MSQVSYSTVNSAIWYSDDYVSKDSCSKIVSMLHNLSEADLNTVIDVCQQEIRRKRIDAYNGGACNTNNYY